jgi:hypothetical protein
LIQGEAFAISSLTITTTEHGGHHMTMPTTEEEFNLDTLADNWPSPIVARSEIKNFSGGLLHPRTMANRDSLGESTGKMMIGGRACYSTRKLVAWMKARQHKQ